MSCISAILWYWGILPFIVKIISHACQKLFNIGGPVGLGAAANVFIGQVEAPLLIKPFINKLSNKYFGLIILFNISFILQAALGIAMTYLNIPWYLALLHQGNSIVMFLLVLTMYLFSTKSSLDEN